MTHPIITLTEWAQLRGITPGRARQLLNEGRLPSAYKSAGTWLIPRDAEPESLKGKP